MQQSVESFFTSGSTKTEIVNSRLLIGRTCSVEVPIPCLKDLDDAALENAVSVANVLLLIEAIVTILSRPEKEQMSASQGMQMGPQARRKE